MKSFDYPVETFEEIINDLDGICNSVDISKSVIPGVNTNYLAFIVKAGKEKNWDSFLKGAYSVVRDLSEEHDLFPILEPIKSFGDEKRMEKGNFKVSLSIRCITIRDIKVELCAKFGDHPFLGTEYLKTKTIPSIPDRYHTDPHTLSTRRPFYGNRLLAYKYAPNENLLLKMDKVIKELQENELVKNNGVSRPRIETSTTLYNKEEGPHQLTYTSYLHNVTIQQIEELFSPLFDTACEFLKGTPRDSVIIQDRGGNGELVMIYPEGKYIPDEEYPIIKE